MFRTTSCLVVGISLLLSVLAGCSSTQSTRPSDAPVSVMIDNRPELPLIPEGATPKTGAVAEFWVDCTLKSERMYQDGEITSAAFYASNGVLVYEMSASKARTARLGDAGN